LTARQLGRNDEAIEVMQKALSISRDFRHYQQLVLWLTEDGQHGRAQQVAAECLSVHKDNPQAHALRSLAIIRRVVDTSLFAVHEFDLLAQDLEIIGRLREGNDFLADVADLIQSVLEINSR
jgi:hypothetical protein